MAMIVAKILFWSSFATVIACVEIEAEGKHGWAEKMPTWYRTTGFWAVLYGRIMNGKPLTGYHLFMFFFPILLFHAPFFMGAPWSGAAELTAWAMYFAWCPLWDYHWFVLNPHYKGRFAKDQVWWHARSRWVADLFPVDYLLGGMLSAAFALASAIVGDSARSFVDHLTLLWGLGLMTFVLQAMSPAYHRWYARMRLRDDRAKAAIFHRDAR